MVLLGKKQKTFVSSESKTQPEKLEHWVKSERLAEEVIYYDS